MCEYGGKDRIIRDIITWILCHFATGDRNMMNSTDEIDLRRYMYNLSNSGAACILFGVWTVIKMFMQVTMDSKTYDELIKAIGITEYDPGFLRMFILITVSFISLFIMFFYLHIGIAAIRFGRGRKRSKTYLLFTAVFTLIMITGIRTNFRNSYTRVYELSAVGVATTIADITLIFVLSDIIFSTLKISTLRKRLNEQQRSA